MINVYILITYKSKHDTPECFLLNVFFFCLARLLIFIPLTSHPTFSPFLLFFLLFFLFVRRWNCFFFLSKLMYLLNFSAWRLLIYPIRRRLDVVVFCVFFSPSELWKPPWNLYFFFFLIRRRINIFSRFYLFLGRTFFFYPAKGDTSHFEPLLKWKKKADASYSSPSFWCCIQINNFRDERIWEL